MPRASRLAAIAVLAISALIAVPLAAQTEFATPLARGQLRLDFTPVWSSWDHRWDPNATGLVPLTADYASDSLGVATLPFLQPLQDTLRAAAGAGFTLNLGHPLIALTASVRTMPIGLEYGLTRRLAIGVTVPIVRSRVDASFQMDTAALRKATWGGTPGYLDSTTVSAFRQQMGAALAALQTQATSGPAGLRAQALATIAALRPFLDVSYAPFLPRGATPGAKNLSTNLSTADSTYLALAAQYAALGDTLPQLSAPLPLPDSTALQTADLERLFEDPALGIGIDSFATIVRTGIGDITAHATYQFAEGGRYRGQIIVTTRFPTGQAPSASNFLDLGTGTHEFGLEAALANDVILNSNFLVHAVARAGGSATDQIPMRVTPPDLPIALLTQVAEIKRQSAPYLALDVDPTWMLDDAFSVRVAYGYFNQGTTRHSYVNPTDELRVGLPANVLDEGTAMRWMRLGAEVTFLTLDRYTKGRASLPYSVSVGYDNTIWGRGWAGAAGERIPRQLQGVLHAVQVSSLLHAGAFPLEELLRVTARRGG